MKEKIENCEYVIKSKRTEEWGGADVIISKEMTPEIERWLGDQNIVISFQSTAPMKRAVITKYSRELSGLFIQLGDIFLDDLDFVSKYDFYGMLAQAAIDSLENNQDIKCNKLLLNVLDKAYIFLNLPDDISLPFFAYGLFKPGQLAFHKIHDLVQDFNEVEITGTLKIRDGLPLFVNKGNSIINGFMIKFKPGLELEAYNRILELEPMNYYKWDEISTEEGRANILKAYKPGRGSDYYEYGSWDEKRDPYFSDALEVIRGVLEDEKNSKDSHPDNLKPFFQLQMAYMLLWSSIERYASLRYHLGGDVNQKILQIAKEDVFAIKLKEIVKGERKITGVNDLKNYTLDPEDPLKSIKYYYKVRSNLVHRGKAVFRDYDIIYNSLKELLDIFENLLHHSLNEY